MGLEVSVSAVPADNRRVGGRSAGLPPLVEGPGRGSLSVSGMSQRVN